MGSISPLFVIIVFSFYLPFHYVRGEESTAKVIMLRGLVKAKLQDGPVIDVKLNQELPEGTLVQTAEKSFVKIILSDKSQINLGPSSQMSINAVPKTQAGIITLLKGQIRSQVTKDYMQIEDKSKSKLFIKTKTAAMGVRGTDFQVNYNPENKNTILITFEGKVALANIDLDQIDKQRLDQDELEKIVSSEKSVLVTEGKISAINFNISSRAMMPTKLNPEQAELLERNITGIVNSENEVKNENEFINGENKSKSEAESPIKKYRDPVPPGVNGSSFSNQYRDKLISKEASSAADMKDDDNNANGHFNKDTGVYKLPPGCLVDLKTLNIVPPPGNAIFDNNTRTYIVPGSYGKINTTTGEYIPPQGVKLDNSGRFIPESSGIKIQTIDSEGRNPNSEQIGPATTPPPPPAGVYDGNPELKEFQEIYSPNTSSDVSSTNTTLKPSTVNPELAKLAEETQTKIEQDQINSSNIGTTAPSSKVKFIIDVN